MARYRKGLVQALTIIKVHIKIRAGAGPIGKVQEGTVTGTDHWQGSGKRLVQALTIGKVQVQMLPNI